VCNLSFVGVVAQPWRRAETLFCFWFLCGPFAFGWEVPVRFLWSASERSTESRTWHEVRDVNPREGRTGTGTLSIEW
jgi:hypothetical protein